MMKKLAFQESVTFPGKSTQSMADQCWFDDASILDMDNFVKTISGIKAKGVRPDLIGSIIAHYASKWLPELSRDVDTEKYRTSFEESSSKSFAASWMKKRFFVETLVGILPPERNSIPCNFLLRLLRTANMVGVEPNYRAELEKRVSWQLDQASLKELMIPSFSHTRDALLDVELVIRLVKGFASLDEGARSVVALVKVAKLVDCYLAEAAIDTMSLDEFVALGAALPSYARAMDDGLYHAIDTYLKAHPDVSKQDRKVLCRLIDSQKLSPEASFHAAQNERLPVRAVIQVLLSEQTKLNRRIDWSGSFNGTRSPNLGLGLKPSARCLSKRETDTQQMEIKKLKEDLFKVQTQCIATEMQMEKILDKKKGFFRWKKVGTMPSYKSSVSVFDKIEEDEDDDEGEVTTFARQEAMDVKAKLVRRRPPSNRRKSMS